jgi:hypothetical protein
VGGWQRSFGAAYHFSVIGIFGVFGVSGREYMVFVSAVKGSIPNLFNLKNEYKCIQGDIP